MYTLHCKDNLHLIPYSVKYLHEKNSREEIYQR